MLTWTHLQYLPGTLVHHMCHEPSSSSSEVTIFHQISEVHSISSHNSQAATFITCRSKVCRSFSFKVTSHSYCNILPNFKKFFLTAVHMWYLRSLTRNWTSSLLWKCRVLTIGAPQGSSYIYLFFNHSICVKLCYHLNSFLFFQILTMIFWLLFLWPHLPHRSCDFIV